MRYSTIILFFVLTGCQNTKVNDKITDRQASYAIAIHGGAGTIIRKDMTLEMEAAYIEALDEAISKGDSILKNKGSALDAVTACIVVLEDSPLFNAGKGAVFTHDGRNELDAAIMDGSNQKAGSIGGVTNVKNPIKGALAVMQKSPHVMLVGKGAELFCAQSGCSIVDPSYFYTEKRWNALQEALKEEAGGLPVSKSVDEKKKGTVGCVALDLHGNLAAGTSTGGMTNKKFGRIGDAPIIGAGTFADNASCAVSCTGHGEFFIRYTVARDVAAMMEYGGKSLAEATSYLIDRKLVEKGGEGGLIAVDRSGNIALPFNSEGMYRAFAKPGKKEIKIFREK